MKHLFTLLLCSLLTWNAYAQQPLNPDDVFTKFGEVYFTFEINDAQSIHTLTKIISIDNVKGSTVWAYANKKEFSAFTKTGLKYNLLPHPAELVHADISDNPAQVLDWNYYPSYSAYETIMHQFQSDHPDICQIVTIAILPSGRKLLAVKISDNIGIDEDEPEFMYVSSMHGDETTGYPTMLHLIDYLLTNYGNSDRITNMVNNMEIYINPLANPDGTYYGGNNTVNGAIRGNANNIDLNRNFPDPQDGQHPDENQWQPETIAAMDFANAHHITMSCNFHGGAEVVNYPWDTWARLHADNNWWIYTSREYADTVHLHSPNSYMTDLNNGITNGYAWYEIDGGRQDYMTYFQHGRESTIELSETKLISASQLLSHWNYNYRSLLNYMEQSLYGIRGIVTDSATGEPLHAKIFIFGHDIDSAQVYTDLPIGNYHRLLKAGNYTLRFSAAGYPSKTFFNIPVTDKNTFRLDVQLYDGSVIPAFTADNTIVPQGYDVHFTDQTYANPTSWQWAFEGGTPATSTEQNPTVIYNAPGIFSVTLTASNAGSSNTLIKDSLITITEDYQMGNFVITTCSGDFVDAGGNGNYGNNEDKIMTFIPADVTKVIKVAFNSFDLQADPGCENDWLRIFDGIDTTATLLGTYCGSNSPGTILSSLSALTFWFHSDNATTASGWTAFVQCDLGVSIDKLTQNGLKVFPNPATGDDVIIESDYPLMEISISDILGRVRTHVFPQSTRYVMPIDALTNGIYVLIVRMKNLSVAQQKLIINRPK